MNITGLSCQGKLFKNYVLNRRDIFSKLLTSIIFQAKAKCLLQFSCFLQNTGYFSANIMVSKLLCLSLSLLSLASSAVG